MSHSPGSGIKTLVYPNHPRGWEIILSCGENLGSGKGTLFVFCIEVLCNHYAHFPCLDTLPVLPSQFDSLI